MHFIIGDGDLHLLNTLPRSFQIYRNNVGINIIYHFRYQIVDWRSWLKIAKIRASLEKLIPSLKWREYDNKYMIQIKDDAKCLESDFDGIIDHSIKFYSSPSVQIGDKKEVTKLLGIECKNLWYQKLFYVEKVIAYSLWLSQTYKHNKNVTASNRQSINRALKTFETFSKIKENYKQKQTAEERKKAYANRKRKTNPLQHEALTLFSSGLSRMQISDKLQVPKRTIDRWLHAHKER